MPNYRRAFVPGGTFFLTLVTHGRARLFERADARTALHGAIGRVRRDRAFGLVAVVLLPDHLHLVLTLPPGDADFSTRVAAIKAGFTREWLSVPRRERAQSAGRERKGYRGVWQTRFWEHHVRDEDDLIGCCDYVHYNPVKHGYTACPHAWPYSSFARCVARNEHSPDWLCVCDGGPSTVPVPKDVAGAEMDGAP